MNIPLSNLVKTLHLSIIVISCISLVIILPHAFADTKESSPSINETQIQLKVNQTMESDNIKVKFLNVIEDSRCPAGVTCIWEGQVKITVNIIKNDQSLGNFVLTSRDEQQDMAIQTFDGHSIQVVRVDPYPTSGKKILPSDYLATFVISESGILSPSTQISFVENETFPVIITQVELDSPFLLMPDNRTCTLPAKPGFINNCRTDLIPGQKVQCAYSLGSGTCEPDHQFTRGTNQSCFGSDGSPNAPQWFDLYNNQNKTVQIRLFQLIILQGGKSWGNWGLFPTKVNLGPHEKCTFGLVPSDEPLSLDQTNMGFAASYTFEGKNYTTSTPPLTDLYNDTRTWQYGGNKWTFAEQNTVTVPEFPDALLVMVIVVTLIVTFYRIKPIKI